MFLFSLTLSSKNPYFLVLALGLAILVTIIFISKTLLTQWFSYLILLLFLGGLLIMFLYLISLVDKEKFQFSFWWALSLWPLYYMLLSSSTSKEMTLNLNPAMMFLHTPLMIFTITFLLITLFTATSLVQSKAGPLRLL